MEASTTDSTALPGKQEPQDPHRGEAEEGLLCKLVKTSEDVGEEDSREHLAELGGAREGLMLVHGNVGAGWSGAEGVELQGRSDLLVGI